MGILDRIFLGNKNVVKPLTEEEKAAAIAKIEKREADEAKYPEGVSLSEGPRHGGEPEAMGNYYRDTERISEPEEKVDNDQEGNIAA